MNFLDLYLTALIVIAAVGLALYGKYRGIL